MNITLTFPEAQYRYWYLYWVGKAHVEKKSSGISLIEFHFINVPECNDKIFDYENNKKKVLKLNIRSLNFLTIGCIYDSNEEMVIPPEDHANYALVSAAGNYNLTSNKLTFITSKYSPLDSKIDLLGLEYYLFKRKDNFDDLVSSIMLSTVLCKNLYFLTTNLTYKLINFDIGHLFKLDCKKVIHEGDEKIGYVTFDKNFIDKYEAKILAPFLFIKNDLGIKSLMSISHFIRHSLSKNGGNSAYLRVTWPFNDYSYFKLFGKKFYVEEMNEKGVNEKKFFLLGNSIFDFKPNNNELTVDRILVEEEKAEMTASSDDDQVIGLSRLGKIKNQEESLSLSNHSSNNVYSDSEIEATNLAFSFDIPIDYITKDVNDPDYNQLLIPTEEQLENATLDTYEKDPNSEYAGVEITYNFKGVLSNFQFIQKTIYKLNIIANVGYNFSCLNLQINNDLTYTFGENKIMIIELTYKKHYFYLVEFERGRTGLIRDFNFNRINSYYLGVFINDCFDYLTRIPKRAHLWSHIRRERRNDGKKSIKIIIEESLNHQRKGFKSIDDMIEFSATKIYNDRLKKLVS